MDLINLSYVRAVAYAQLKYKKRKQPRSFMGLLSFLLAEKPPCLSVFHFYFAQNAWRFL